MKGILFPSLPYNTKRIYVMGTAKGGCEIYVPFDDRKNLEGKKNELQTFLDSDYFDDAPIPEELA